MRAGQAAAAEAARRRTAEAAADEARQQLAAYWGRQAPHCRPGLPPRLTAASYYEQAERDARALEEHQRKSKSLEERRNKLSMMFFHENLQYKQELKDLALQNKMNRRSTYLGSVPTSVLRDVNLGFLAKEEERRRQEAEIRLYHQWRTSQPVLQRAERAQRHGALKSAWMEQSIEKEMAKKKDEEELSRILTERDKNIKREIDKEREEMLVKEERMKDLREHLCRQIEELRESEKAAANLRLREEVEQDLLVALQELSIVRSKGAARRHAARGTLLGNMALQARRLRERAREAERDVQADLHELAAISDAINKDAVEENVARQEWREALKGAHESLMRQRQLEQQRQRRLEDAMDGEARAIAANQEKIWQQEHAARQVLLDEVLSTLKEQVQTKLLQLEKLRGDNIKQREAMLEEMEVASQEMEAREQEKEKKKQDLHKMTALQIQMKQLKEEKQQEAERQEQVQQLRDAAQEEERLRNELIRMQRDGCAFQMYRKRRVLW